MSEPGRAAHRPRPFHLAPVWSNMLLCSLAAPTLAALVYSYPRIPFLNLHNGLLVPLYAALIYGALHPHLIFSRVLRAPWLVALGNASFGLYLIHMPLLHLFQGMHIPVSFLTIGAYLLLSICLSIASLRWFEEPSRKWIPPLL